MSSNHHAKTGVGALAAYAAIVVITACVLYELGSDSLGYASLASKLLPAPAEQPAAAQRYGKVLVRSKLYGACHAFSLDNETQQLVAAGTVECDHGPSGRRRSKTDVFREAFGGQ